MDAEQLKKAGLTRECLLCGLVVNDGSVICPEDGSALKTVKPDPYVGLTLLGRYEVLSLIGSGGMGNVYKSRHKLMDRLVAIKILHVDRIGGSSRFKRFQQEARMASALSHPNIVAAFDFGITENEIPFLVMDYIEGTSLQEVLEKEGTLSSERAIAIFGQSCDALAHAHQKGIIHRDIKPSNIMLVPGGAGAEMVKVLDFGIAKILPQADGKEASLTVTGEVFGSPQYMSPEQCTGKALDARSDVYSLGCVIYEALTGRPPIVGDNLLETIFKHSNELPPSFKKVRPDLTIAEQLEAVVFKTLEKDPDNRFQSMTILKRNLEFAPRFAEQARNVAPAASKPLQWRNSGANGKKAAALPGVILGIAMLLAAALAGAEIGCNHAVSFAAAQVQLQIEEKLAGNDSEKLIPVLTKMGRLYAGHGSWGKAILTYQRFLQIVIEHDGADSLAAARAYIALGNLYHDVHNRKSESCWQNASKILGGLSGSNRAAGRYAENEPLDRLSVELRKKLFGEDHPETAASLLDLANDLKDAGQFEQAEPIYKEAIAMRQKLLGPDDLSVADALCQLGNFWAARGKYSQAEDKYKQALEIKTRALGEKNSAVAALHTRLAHLYEKSGRFNEAEASFLDALAVERAAGGESEKVALSLDDLAGLYKEERKYSEAQDMYQMSLTLKERLASPPESLAASLNGLAAVSFLQAQYPKAEGLFRRQLDLLPADSGKQKFIDVLQQLSDTCKAQGKEQEVRELQEKMQSLR